MIRYRKLNEAIIPDDIVRFGDIVYAGYIWKIIDIKNNIATLLLDEDICHMDFGMSRQRYPYIDSKVQKYLLNTLLPELEANGAKPIPTLLYEEECYNKLYLLSYDEAQTVPKSIRKFSGDWWLRTVVDLADDYDEYARTEPLIVSRNGDLDYPVRTKDHAVRPAMRVRIEDIK